MAGADVLTKSLGSNPHPQHVRARGLLLGFFSPASKGCYLGATTKLSAHASWGGKLGIQRTWMKS